MLRGTVTIERWGYLQLVLSYNQNFIIESAAPGEVCHLRRPSDG